MPMFVSHSLDGGWNGTRNSFSLGLSLLTCKTGTVAVPARRVTVRIQWVSATLWSHRTRVTQVSPKASGGARGHHRHLAGAFHHWLQPPS